MEAMARQLEKEELCCACLISPGLESESLHRDHSEIFKGLPRVACEGLPGHISSSAALLRGMVSANLKTSARVTSLLALPPASAFEYMVG